MKSLGKPELNLVWDPIQHTNHKARARSALTADATAAVWDRMQSAPQRARPGNQTSPRPKVRQQDQTFPVWEETSLSSPPQTQNSSGPELAGKQEFHFAVISEVLAFSFILALG